MDNMENIEFLKQPLLTEDGFLPSPMRSGTRAINGEDATEALCLWTFGIKWRA